MSTPLASPTAQSKLKYLAFLNILPALIQFAENIHGPAKGAEKATTVLGLAQTVLTVSMDTGIVPPIVGVAANIITSVIESTLATMKQDGTLVPQAELVAPIVSPTA